MVRNVPSVAPVNPISLTASSAISGTMENSSERQKRKLIRNVVGLEIRRLREKRNWSQSDLSSKLQLAGWDIERTVLTRKSAQKPLPFFIPRLSSFDRRKNSSFACYTTRRKFGLTIGG